MNNIRWAKNQIGESLCADLDSTSFKIGDFGGQVVGTLTVPGGELLMIRTVGSGAKGLALLRKAPAAGGGGARFKVVNVGGPIDGQISRRSLRSDYLNIELTPPSSVPYPHTIAGDFNRLDLSVVAGTEVRVIKVSNASMIPTPRGFVDPTALVSQASAVGARRVVVSTGPQSIVPLVDTLRTAGFNPRVRNLNGRATVTGTVK
jgi:hypothetical protein